MTMSSVHSILPAQWGIEQRVLRIVASECNRDADDLTLDTRLIEDLGIDSLAVVELMMALEEEFAVTIPDRAAQQVFTDSPATLRTLSSLVRECWGSGEPARNDCRGERSMLISAEKVPFTQFGPDYRGDADGLLHERIGVNREGYAEYRRRTDGMRCIHIAAGVARLGSDRVDAPSDQRPAHIVRLSEFLIDAEPVSNVAFAAFLNALGDISQEILEEWCGVDEDDRRRAQFALRCDGQGWTPVTGTEQQPMILVSWFGANAYSLWAHRCDWRYYRADGSMPAKLETWTIAAAASSGDLGFSRLPTEAQWEYAARGEPTARQPEKGAICAARHIVGAGYAADSLPVATVSERLGMSPFGLHHMGGNVWQWCRDWYSAGFYSLPEACTDDPASAVPTGIRSERGGSWVGPDELAEPSFRRGRPPAARGRCLGFRCVFEEVPADA